LIFVGWELAAKSASVNDAYAVVVKGGLLILGLGLLLQVVRVFRQYRHKIRWPNLFGSARAADGGVVKAAIQPPRFEDSKVL